MRKTKKLLALALAVLFVLSTVVTGFAADFSDVADTDYEDAVTRLVALDIISGFPDGTFKPAEPVTRAQMAKIICQAVGVGSAAEYAKGATGFSDVPAEHWASGFIKVAADMGIVNGMGDGTFAPEAQVTYAQAVTMIVRALGYEPAAKAKGGYPGGYIAIAAEKDISEGVNVVNTLAANRGDIALMVDNALDVNLMEQTTYGQYPEYAEVEGKTLLKTKLSVDEVVGRVVGIADVDSSLDDDELTIDITEKNGKEVDEGEKDYRVLGKIDPNALFGLKVKAWVKDKKVFFASIETSDKDILRDSAAGAVANGEVELVVLDDTVKVADDAVVYVNFAEKNKGAIAANMYGLFVKEKGKVVFANLFNNNKSVVVTGVSGEDIKYFDTSETEKTLRLSKADSYKIFNPDFTAASIEDIEEDDVLYWWVDDSDYYLTLVQNKVEGTLEKLRADKVWVGDKGVSIPKTGVTYSLDNDDEIKVYDNSAETIKDLADEEVVALLDINGKVRHLRGETEATSGTIYAIAIDKYRSGSKYMADFFTADGEEVAYEFENRNDYNLLGDFDADDDFYPVWFKLNSDGKIKKEVFHVAVDKTIGEDKEADTRNKDKDEYYVQQLAKGTDNKYVTYKVGGTTTRFYVDSSTKIFKALDKVGDLDPEVLEYKAFVESGFDAATKTLALVKGEAGKDAKMIVFLDAAFDGAKEDFYYGVVTDKPWKQSGKWKVEIDVLGEGKVVYIFADEDDITTIDRKGDLVEFKLNAKGELVLANEVDFRSAAKLVTEVKDHKYVTTSLGTFRLDSDAVVYDVDSGGDFNSKIDKNDIDKDDKIIFITDDEDYVIKAAIVKTYAAGEVVPGDDDEQTAGTVTYINDTRIFIDGERYAMDEDTVLYDKDGKTVKHVGGENINSFLTTNSLVKDVEVKDNVVTEMTLVKTAEEIEEEEALAEAVKAAEEAIADLPEEINLDAKELVEAARALVEAALELDAEAVIEGIEVLEAAEARIEELEEGTTQEIKAIATETASGIGKNLKVEVVGYEDVATWEVSKEDLGILVSSPVAIEDTEVVMFVNVGDEVTVTLYDVDGEIIAEELVVVE